MYAGQPAEEDGWMGCQAVDVTDMGLPTDCSRKLFCAANEILRSENSRVVVIAININFTVKTKFILQASVMVN